MEREIRVSALSDVWPATPRALIAKLKEIYTGNIGFDCAHVDNHRARAWLYAVAENGATKPGVDRRRTAAKRTIEANEFEQFFNRRFLGKKRFGAEGAEAMVPWFDAVLARSAELGVRDVVIGGAHRVQPGVHGPGQATGRLGQPDLVAGKIGERADGEVGPHATVGIGDVRFM